MTSYFTPIPLKVYCLFTTSIEYLVKNKSSVIYDLTTKIVINAWR